jgi:hypothetical protein
MHPARSGDRNFPGGDRAIADRGIGFKRRGDRYTLDRWYITTGAPSVPVDPSTIAGLMLWLKADSLALADGALVATWPDSSGNGNNATASGSLQPVFKTNILNGKPVIRFTGVQGFVLTTPIANTANGPWTVIAVIRPVDLAKAFCSVAGENANFGPYQSSNTWFLGIHSAKWQYTIGAVALAAHILSGNTNAQFYDNGVSDPAGINYANTVTADFARIAERGAGDAADGDMAEIVVYNSVLSSANRSGVEKFLGNKYGITVA